ncbi:hypothetical protein M422DRAFT_250266 [Sphaerobolus stellatus SS14]|uniref:Uncharacterized protein n=1 Tax=Sphaerobolus stellatus (strain SS14) TaxID=990650 RepID=A0A0C9W4D2_SPHS4|nr:hypothetical protein M422DRAFT_250266 [Sphaerobolus stellatus SS14]
MARRTTWQGDDIGISSQEDHIPPASPLHSRKQLPLPLAQPENVRSQRDRTRTERGELYETEIQEETQARVCKSAKRRTKRPIIEEKVYTEVYQRHLSSLEELKARSDIHAHKFLRIWRRLYARARDHAGVAANITDRPLLQLPFTPGLPAEFRKLPALAGIEPTASPTPSYIYVKLLCEYNMEKIQWQRSR